MIPKHLNTHRRAIPIITEFPRQSNIFIARPRLPLYDFIYDFNDLIHRLLHSADQVRLSERLSDMFGVSQLPC